MSGRSRGGVGSGSRGVLAEIDERLKTLEQQLAEREKLLAERERLLAARATLLGEGPAGQISQQDVRGVPGRASRFAPARDRTGAWGVLRTDLCAPVPREGHAFCQPAGRLVSARAQTNHRPVLMGAPHIRARVYRRVGVASGASHSEPRRAAREPLRARDLELLRWLGEQYGARVDQIEVLLGCGPRTVERSLARLRAAGLIDTRRLLVGEPSWAISTSAGLRTAGQGFGLWRPRVALLAHVAAVNDLRLHIGRRSPESEWVCERARARERQPGEHLPDAVVITEERRVAIEVELSVKSQRRVRSILDELSSRFEAILYFCAPAPHRQLSRLTETGRWPELGVRELPNLHIGTP